MSSEMNLLPNKQHGNFSPGLRIQCEKIRPNASDLIPVFQSPNMLAEPLSSLSGIFLGSYFATALWGVTCSQVFRYASTQTKDSLYIKGFVALVWLFDTIHQFLVIAYVFDYCIEHFGNVMYLLAVPKSFPPQLALLLCIYGLVQGFYVVRIWQLSHKSRTRWVAVPIVLLMLVEAGAGVYSINAIASAGSWLLALRRAYTPGLVWISAAFVIDVTITSAMCYLLRRGRTEYARTNTVLEKLTLFIVCSNLLNACVRLSVLIVLVLFPVHLYIVPLLLISSRLHANSFLASLNMRPYIRQRMNVGVLELSATRQRSQQSHYEESFKEIHTR